MGMSTREKPLCVAIVGCGSRGLSVLERLTAWAVENRTAVDIHLYDPQRPGPGVHATEQPEYLMLNTVASQISMFPDDVALGGYPGRCGPNFHQWCLRYKAEHSPAPNQFLPRRWLGEYLAWTYDVLLAGLPAFVRIIHHPWEVREARRLVEGGWQVEGGGQTQAVDSLLLCVGHSAGGQPAVPCGGMPIMDAYPLPRAVDNVAPGSAVLVQGMGLSAMDVVSALTVGRGGHFQRDAQGQLSYLRSGREPKVYLYSRHGMPYRTRPDIDAHRRPTPASIFTQAMVSDLLANYPDGIDFQHQVVPLIEAEMHAEYYATVARLQGGSEQDTRARVAKGYFDGDLERVLAGLAREWAVLPLDTQPFMPGMRVPVEGYQDWVREVIERDLLESRAGIDGSPLKAAAEVWRNCREQLRRLVDDQGLTPASHAAFFADYAPLVNRLVAGPQKERHEELLALADAGVLCWLHASQVQRRASDAWLIEGLAEEGVVTVDALVRARVVDNRQADAQPAVIRSLRDAGMLQGLDGDGHGVRVDGEGRALNERGYAQPGLWLTGPIVEGATYYNHYVPSGGGYSRAFADANRIARGMLGLDTGGYWLPVPAGGRQQVA